jgi:hypothetical protein
MSEAIELVRRAVKWMEHKNGCKVYGPARGGSAYDADDEDACNCGLKRWQEEARKILARQSNKK